MASSVFKPLEFLISDQKILLILLNQPITNNVLKKLWTNAVLKICCDGATNHLYDFNLHHSDNDESYIPDFICGDLDSASDEAIEYFSKRGAEIIRLEDQNATDFTKGTQFAIEQCKKKNLQYEAIISFPAFGGRIDHMLSNINTLYTIDRIQSKPCYLLSSIDVACLLKPGKSTIVTKSSLEGEWCGLVPMNGEAANVTTTGLKYNLESNAMKFGGLISTSNSLAPGWDAVTVDTSHHLLWILGYVAEKV